MSKRIEKERIWLARGAYHDPIVYSDPVASATEYIRKDIHDAEIARLREALQECDKFACELVGLHPGALKALEIIRRALAGDSKEKTDG